MFTRKRTPDPLAAARSNDFVWACGFYLVVLMALFVTPMDRDLARSSAFFLAVGLYLVLARRTVRRQGRPDAEDASGTTPS